MPASVLQAWRSCFPPVVGGIPKNTKAHLHTLRSSGSEPNLSKPLLQPQSPKTTGLIYCTPLPAPRTLQDLSSGLVTPKQQDAERLPVIIGPCKDPFPQASSLLSS